MRPLTAQTVSMHTSTQEDLRAEGFASMSQRLMGCLGVLPSFGPAERIAFLEGMLAALDRTRANLVEDIAQCERVIEHVADADFETYRSEAWGSDPEDHA